jgi:cytoskeleton protein RodZ
MSDEAAELAPVRPAPSSEPAPSSFGPLLAAARERAGMTIEDAAARLRLHPRQLQALEREDLEALPASPYVAGFVRNYARELKLEPGVLLESLNARLAARGDQGPSLDLGGVRASGLPVLDERRWRQLMMTVIVGVLVCAGLIGFWMAHPRGHAAAIATRPAPEPTDVAPAPAAGAAPSTEASAVASVADQRTSTVAAPAVPTPTAPMAAPAPAVPAIPVSPGATPAAASPAGGAPRAASASAVTPGAARAGPGGLVLRFNDRSWFEVSQADGRVLMSHIGEPGSLELLNANVPLQLVVGRAEAVQVEYRGLPVDLKPYVSGNGVARLTLAEGRISGGGLNTR